jgi:hypothetical protein
VHTALSEQRLVEHVQRLGAEHPPIDLDSVDYTVRDPGLLRSRYGHVLDYMARVELEVDRNVLELITLLPDPPEVDRTFYGDVWQPQEIRHGTILDELQTRIGRPNADPDLGPVSVKIRVLGALAHLSAVQDVVRLLYYLTGMATERSAVLAYNRLYDGVVELGETAVAQTIVSPIRRQEPGHYAFYRLSALGLVEQLRPWQLWLVRRIRQLSFEPVGAGTNQHKADFGDLLVALDVDGELPTFAEQIGRVERDLLWAHRQGMSVPPYVMAAFREAVQLADDRRGAA